MSSFYEKARPKRLEDICGHEKALRKIITLNKTVGLTGQALWITGESGTGKTTIARIIAGIVADPCTTWEYDAQDVTLDTLREWERQSQFRPLFGNGYAFIVNEAHCLSSKAVSRLQTLLEDGNVQKNSTWLFTTTFKGEQSLFDSKMDACPFLSRAVDIRLELDALTVHSMAERLQSIARSESLDGKPVEDYLSLLEENQYNMRQCLQKIAAGEMLD